MARNVAAALNDDFCNELLTDSDLKQEKKKDFKSVITSHEEAKKRFTPRHLFVVNECRIAALKDLRSVGQVEGRAAAKRRALEMGHGGQRHEGAVGGEDAFSFGETAVHQTDHRGDIAQESAATLGQGRCRDRG